ncbi:hypothetical protein PV10_04286 [Exophiala mesophila]|uniref:Uncharacterized protein n=1 Tax=Exophiala mesophila TaxID=212818 RepID=A0A0D1XXW6_EXOME|nr:uncharacterized protein PV10_04286 [Exophiala mesophila]KIV93041.1 hypothetical protein PV10_04286 [Exophiala mesophila]
MNPRASLFALALYLFQLCIAKQSKLASQASTYTNPILDGVGADPWVVHHGDSYYMTYTTHDNITILRSNTLTDWHDAETKLAFSPPPDTEYSYSLWAPELHFFDELDRWYIIFTADVDPDHPSPIQDMLCDFTCPAVNHRMFVLESTGSDPWTSNYTFKSQLDTFDQFAIDGTYFIHSTGLYHIYSCWHDKYISWPAMLCITRMTNPWTVSSTISERQIISRPDQPWEKTPYGRTVNDRLSSNEGPQQLTNAHTGQQFLIYSAARSDNRNYCLGQLELTGQDPMDPAAWTKFTRGCVFEENPAAQVYGVGHASFTTSPDDKENWIIYHGMHDFEKGWDARSIRTQHFTWNKDGSPRFPKPAVGPFAFPSGQDGTSGDGSGSAGPRAMGRRERLGSTGLQKGLSLLDDILSEKIEWLYSKIRAGV